MSATTAATVLHLYGASERCQIAHGLLLAAGNVEAAKAAHEAGEAIARCLGLVVVGESKRAVVRP